MESGVESLMKPTRAGFFGLLVALPAALVARHHDSDLDQIPDFVGPEGIGLHCLNGIKVNGVLAKNCSGWWPKLGRVQLFDFQTERTITPRSVEPMWKPGHGPDGKVGGCSMCSPWRRVYKGVA